MWNWANGSDRPQTGVGRIDVIGAGSRGGWVCKVLWAGPGAWTAPYERCLLLLLVVKKGPLGPDSTGLRTNGFLAEWYWAGYLASVSLSVKWTGGPAWEDYCEGHLRWPVGALLVGGNGSRRSHPRPQDKAGGSTGSRERGRGLQPDLTRLVLFVCITYLLFLQCYTSMFLL